MTIIDEDIVQRVIDSPLFSKHKNRKYDESFDFWDRDVPGGLNDPYNKMRPLNHHDQIDHGVWVNYSSVSK